MSQQKNRPAPRQRDLVAAQRAAAEQRHVPVTPGPLQRAAAERLGSLYSGFKDFLEGSKKWGRSGAPTVRPSRDRRSRTSGRLRTELAFALDHPELLDEDLDRLAAALLRETGLQLADWQRDWIRWHYAPVHADVVPISRRGGRR